MIGYLEMRDTSFTSDSTTPDGAASRGTTANRIAVASLLLAASALAVAPVEAQEIRGILSDRDSYTPIDIGEVALLDSRLDTLAQAITDENGYFVFPLPESGEYYVIASALGYQALRSEPLFVGADEVRVVEIHMESRPLPVEGIVVEARADEPQAVELRSTGFYERMAEGRGEYLTPGQIAASEVRWPQQLFWGMRTVRVHQRSHERAGIWNDILVIPNRQSRGYCRPSVYVDGRWIREDMIAEGASLADIVHKEEILAVEVYEWPFGVPRLYTGKQACGVILFWTEYVDDRSRPPHSSEADHPIRRSP